MIKKLIPIFLLLILSALMLSACSDKCKHNYVETVYPSTCKDNGYTQRLCTECGDEQKFDYKPRSGHSGEWQIAKEPTCQSVGTEERICLTCNTVYETRSISKLGHISGEWKTTKAPNCKETGMEKLFCITCGIELEVKTLSVTENHDFSTKVTPPTTEAQGYTTYTCKVCDFSKKDDYVSKIEADTELSATEIHEKAAASTVKIEAYDKKGRKYGTGSGFFISNDGKIATNYHVIKGAYTVKATLYSDNSTHSVINVLGYNIAQDVAIIQIDLENASYLEISQEPLKVGETVYTLGSPMGIENIFSTGIVSNPSVMISGKECISFTAPISSGNSGGPLLNSKCEVVGINTMTVIDTQNLNLAIMSKQITSLSLENPRTPSVLYEEKLAENAYDVLYLSIMLNAQSVNGDKYIIYQNYPEANGNAGFDYYFISDSEKKNVTVMIYIVKNGKRTHRVELTIGGISEKYRFSLYDMKLNDYTLEATVNAAVKPESYESSFDALFKLITFRYDENDDPTADKMKQIFYLMYTLSLDGLQKYFNASGTGLKLAHFNISF